MFNLLPENLKQAIKREYRFRKLTIILIFILCIQISFLIVIFPSWIISLYNEKEIVAQSEDMNKSLSDLNVAPIIDTIKALNKKLQTLNSSLEYPQIIPLMDSVISKKTNAIKLTEFSYSLSTNGDVEFVAGGVSTTREALVSFEKSLEDSKVFSDVRLPISNLAKDKNIKFSISMKVIKQ